MGAETTITIGKGAALAYVIRKVVAMDNKELEYIVDRILAERVYNCNIVDGQGEDDYLVNN